jgi:hypothetical protein
MFEIFDDSALNYSFFNIARHEHNDSIASNTKQQAGAKK